MDAAIIVIIGLIFCLKVPKVQPGATMAEEPTTIVQEAVQIETKLNENFYEDEHAFEEVAHGLNFC